MEKKHQRVSESYSNESTLERVNKISPMELFLTTQQKAIDTISGLDHLIYFDTDFMDAYHNNRIYFQAQSEFDESVILPSKNDIWNYFELRNKFQLMKDLCNGLDLQKNGFKSKENNFYLFISEFVGAIDIINSFDFTSIGIDSNYCIVLGQDGKVLQSFSYDSIFEQLQTMRMELVDFANELPNLIGEDGTLQVHEQIDMIDEEETPEELWEQLESTVMKLSLSDLIQFSSEQEIMDAGEKFSFYN